MFHLYNRIVLQVNFKQEGKIMYQAQVMKNFPLDLDNSMRN